MRTFSQFTLVVAIAVQMSPAQELDLNGDSAIDCHDIEVLQASSGNVNQWLVDASTVFGYELKWGDVDLDGDVDRRDFNVLGSNWIVRLGEDARVCGWCSSDFDGNGQVTSSDKGHLGTWWQQGTDGTPWFTADIDVVENLSSFEAWKPGGIVFAQTNQFDLVAMPQVAPNGVLATNVVARMHDDSHSFVSIDNVRISGDVHQAWLSGRFEGPTAQGEPEVGAAYHADWIPYDTHLLIGPREASASAGGGYFGISETNDGTDPTGQAVSLPRASGFPVKLGVGELSSSYMADIFSVDYDQPLNELALAHFVTPVSPDGQAGQVFLTIGLQGANSENLSLPDVGIIDSIPVPFFTYPCDFDADGTCELGELDALVRAIGREDERYNLDSNPNINGEDIDIWLSFASRDRKLVRGDTDLDGNVDAADLNRLGVNWQIPGEHGWSGGDFDGSGIVDAADLNVIGLNWQHGAESPAAAIVPEPNFGWALLILGLLAPVFPAASGVR